MNTLQAFEKILNHLKKREIGFILFLRFLDFFVYKDLTITKIISFLEYI